MIVQPEDAREINETALAEVSIRLFLKLKPKQVPAVRDAECLKRKR
jgi:hypothetical protein